MKKYLLWIIATITIIILVALFLIFRSRGDIISPKTTGITIEKVSESKVSYPSLYNNNIYYLDRENLSINKIDLTNNKISTANHLSSIDGELISDMQVFWNNHNKDLYLIYYEEGLIIETNWYLGNLNSNEIKKIPVDYTDSIKWKDKDNVVYIDYNNYIKTLNIHSFKESVERKIDTQDILEIFPSTNGEKAIMAETLEGEITDSPVLIYDFNTNEIKDLEQNYIRNPLWSPNSDKILFDKYIPDGKGRTRGIFVWSGTEKKQLNFGETLKTIWLNEDFIISAVPQREGSDYDDFYKVNIEIGEKTLLFKSSKKEHYSAENLILAEDDKTLYFTSDGYLYKMNLE